MEEQFEVCTYGFNKLAQLYFPHTTKRSASRMFGRWLSTNEKLMEGLTGDSWRGGGEVLYPEAGENHYRSFRPTMRQYSCPVQDSSPPFAPVRPTPPHFAAPTIFRRRNIASINENNASDGTEPGDDRLFIEIVR